MRIKIEFDKKDGTKWMETSIDTKDSADIGTVLAQAFNMAGSAGGGGSNMDDSPFADEIATQILLNDPCRSELGFFLSELVELFECEGPSKGVIRGIIFEAGRFSEAGLERLEDFKQRYKVEFVPPETKDTQ